MPPPDPSLHVLLCVDYTPPSAIAQLAAAEKPRGAWHCSVSWKMGDVDEPVLDCLPWVPLVRRAHASGRHSAFPGDCSGK
jgi:hypothetical protein